MASLAGVLWLAAPAGAQTTPGGSLPPAIQAAIAQGNAESAARLFSQIVQTNPQAAQGLAIALGAAAAAAGRTDMLSVVVERAGVNVLTFNGAGATAVLSGLVAGIVQGASAGTSRAATTALVDQLVLAADRAVNSMAAGASGVGDAIKVAVRGAVLASVGIPVEEQPPIDRNPLQRAQLTFEPPARQPANASAN